MLVTILLSLWTLWLVKVKTNIFDLSRDHSIEVSRDCMGGFLSS